VIASSPATTLDAPFPVQPWRGLVLSTECKSRQDLPCHFI
jgi:hypothetical protein